jgi:hypothetical protein
MYPSKCNKIDASFSNAYIRYKTKKRILPNVIRLMQVFLMHTFGIRRREGKLELMVPRGSNIPNVTVSKPNNNIVTSAGFFQPFIII